MLRATLLCSAGLALECADAILFIDLPNGDYPPFYQLPTATWREIMERRPPYDRVCGFYFTHCHPDHYDGSAVAAYRERWPSIPVFLQDGSAGCVEIGPFSITYAPLPHAPMAGVLPPHSVSWIRAGERTVYLPADGELDSEKHRSFLQGRRADAAFWNTMFLSRPDTRALMRAAAEKNYIYHMPAGHRDNAGIWRKCEANFRRNAAELDGITVLGDYPTTLYI